MIGLFADHLYEAEIQDLWFFFFAESVKKAYCEQIKILHFQLKTYIELLVQKLYAAAKPSTSPS